MTNKTTETRTLKHTMNGGRAIIEGESGEVLQWFDWNLNGGHLCQIVGDGDRQRRVEVMISPTATAGSVQSDQEALDVIARAYGVEKIKVDAPK